MGTSTVNPVNNCVGCGQTDDHPRHSIFTGDPSTPWVDWHKDCHANTGCEVCKTELNALPGYESGVIGDEFRSLLVAKMESEGNDAGTGASSRD
jgi:hypothetical protein